MLREKIVFGPIFSRRLGASLGINLLPEKGKICNFDCIYCECGWNRDGREDRRMPTAEELRSALSAKLQECRAAGTPIDSITFSGDIWHINYGSRCWGRKHLKRLVLFDILLV